MLGVEGGMGLTFLPGLKPMIHHLNWYFKYWICKMKLFWLIFNTESVLWWRTCLDFKHLEEAFGYFGACTLISLSTYTFRKTLYNWGTGETGFDHNPNCHSVYSPPVQSGFLQFCCLLIPNAISKPAKAELPLQLEIFFIKSRPRSFVYSLLRIFIMSDCWEFFSWTSVRLSQVLLLHQLI